LPSSFYTPLVRQPTHVRALSAAALLALTMMAACSGSEPSGADTIETILPTSTTVHPQDGALVVGAILPRSGSAAEIGLSMSDALRVALAEINAAGGVNGTAVRLITAEEGESSATAALAVQSLAPRVDAIIGPTSSLNILGTLGAAVDAGVLTCGPTATALALDRFPDDGLFFRTVPSDSLEAVAIAEEVEASGSSSVLVVYLDDGYGRPFGEATQNALLAQGTRVSATLGFNANEESIAAVVAQVVANPPEVVAVIADGTTGPAIINAIDEAAPNRVTYVVNDAVRRPAASAQPFTPGLALRVTGVAPVANADSAAFTQSLLGVNPAATGLYAHNAYDCLTIIALAAQAAGTDQPNDMASAVMAVTSSGSGCATFALCSAALADGRNINYNGPSGNLAIDTNGNVVSANFERFTFDSSGRDVADGIIAVGTD
jgi:branched-chain amino acid transport system substrate-binding protein